MHTLLTEERFAFIKPADKAFLIAFNWRMNEMGYDCGKVFRDGFCWGIFMLVYTKTGVKSSKCCCRVYIRKESIAVRLYLNKIDEHRAFIEQAPEGIKTAFTNEFGRCGHCHNERDGFCRHRKSYSIDGNLYEKCDGYTFEFWAPDEAKTPDYLALLNEFYPQKMRKH